MDQRAWNRHDLPPFDREAFRFERTPGRIGHGEIGGKARGLVFARHVLHAEFGPRDDAPIEVDIPRFVVVATDVFEAFVERNHLHDVARSDASDERIAHAFQQGDLPAEVLGDLRAMIDLLRAPLAVRSSSRLEDALFDPFAGVYETKMTPNNQPDAATRFQRLVEAMKFVYASTFFKSARDYRRSSRESAGEEKMAVILQEVVGQQHGERFYPDVSGVARSFNFYPTGGANREEGVVDLALGLGKTIVDGGLCYSYSPARPKSPPPYGSTRELLAVTQKDFWAVNVGKVPPFNPIAETEYLIQGNLPAAEYDGTLRYSASTYVAASDRVTPSIGLAGPRILNFAPLLVLEQYPLNAVVRSLLRSCERAVGRDVEIEFAMTFPTAAGSKPRFGFLQIRPMVVSDEEVHVDEAELSSPNVLLASRHVMGNGVVDTIRDVVYVRPDVFEARHTRAVGEQLEKVNARLLDQDRPYLLIGFGRWGSSDPWLGIPVKWGQISGAKAIVEATRPDMMIEASQGSHFFHNISSFKVSYFSVPYDASPGIDWRWLEGNEVVAETAFVRHVRTAGPLLVKVDGRSGRGAVWHRT